MADDVQVKFGAQIEGLIAGVNQAKEQIASVTDPISGVMSAFQGLAEVAGAAFAVDRLIEFEDKYAELGEQIERTARITGISTGQIQLFRLAIQLAGGDADTASQTLNIFEKNIGDAISKAGPARSAFEGMGISLDQLKNTDAVTLLFELKQRLDEAGNSAEQSALKQEYLRTVAGRQAAQFLALNLTMEQVKKIAGETGNTMSPEMVSKASELADSTHQLGAAWTGLSNTIASEVEPAYKSLIDLTTKLVEGTNHLLGGADKLKQGYESAAMLDEDTERGRDLGQGQFGPNQQTNPLQPLSDGTDATAPDNSAEREQIAIERSDLAEKLEMYKLDEAAKKASDQIKVDSGLMSNGQMLADLRTSLEGEKAAAIAEITAEQALYDEDSAAWEQLQNKKLIVAKQYDNQIVQIAEKSAADQKKKYDQLFTGIKSAMDGMVTGILQGTQTMQQAMLRLVDNLGVKFAQLALNKLLDWTKAELQSVTVTQTADAAKVASNTAAAGASDAVGAAHLIKEITSSAAATYAGVFAFMSPELGPFAAIPAGIAAGTVGAMTGLVSLDVGAWNLGSDTVAQLHQGEMVVPKNFAAGLRDSGGIGGGGDSYTININAIDTQTGAMFLKNHAALIASNLSSEARNFNRNTPAWKS